MSDQPERADRAGLSGRCLLATVALLTACAVWGCWPVIDEMIRRWGSDPTYSHGYLVPLFALAILWARRDSRPSNSRSAWWGIGLIALGASMQLIGALYYVRWLVGASIVPYVAGATAIAGGWPLLRWAGPAIGFLVFMVPLPYRVDNLLQGPLRRISTLASGFALQTLGLPAVVEGNVILLDDVELGVIDACSGLKMFIIFFCIATAVAMLVRRPLVDRILIVLSAAPIAVVCNVVRITLTGLMHEFAGRKVADLVFHDLAGWLMMPMALVLLWCEIKLIDALLNEAGPSARAPRPVVSPIRLTTPAPLAPRHQL